MPPALTPMDALAEELVELIGLLERCGEPYWSRRLQQALTRLDRNELAGASAVLASFAGPGSLTDLELLPAQRSVTPDRHRQFNRQLDSHRKRLFELSNLVVNATARYQR